MPLFTVTLTQMATVGIEAPSKEALDKALDDVELFDEIATFVDDPDAADYKADIEDARPEVPIEVRLRADGKFERVERAGARRRK